MLSNMIRCERTDISVSIDLRIKNEKNRRCQNVRVSRKPIISSIPLMNKRLLGQKIIIAAIPIINTMSVDLEELLMLNLLHMQVKIVDYLLIDIHEGIMVVDRVHKVYLDELVNLDIDKIIVGANTIRLFF